MKRKKDLFELIQSMTIPEIRYFKRIAASHKKENNAYIELFDVIKSQKEYDEYAIKNSLITKSSMVKHLDVKKHYLYDLILDSLSSYRDNNYAYENTCTRARILLNCGLYDQALRLTDKGLHDCIKSEDFAEGITIINLRKSIIPLCAGQNTNEDEKTEQILYEKLNNLHEYELLDSIYRKEWGSYLFARNKRQYQLIHKILENPLLKNLHHARCIKSKILFHTLHSNIQFTLCNWQENLFHAAESVKLFEKSGFSIARHPEIAVKVYNNYTSAAVMNLNWRLFRKGIASLRDLHLGFNDTQLRFLSETRILQYELIVYRLTRPEKEYRAMVEKLTEFTLKHTNHFESFKYKMICFELGKCYYNLGNFRKARTWLRKTPAPGKLTETLDVYIFSQFLLIMIALEENETKTIMHDILNLKQLMIRSGVFYKEEKTILKLLTYWLKELDNKECVIQAFRNFHSESLTFATSVNKYFNFPEWAETKMNQFKMCL